MFQRVVFELQAPKVLIRGVLASRTVAMVTFCATKIIYLAMIGISWL